MTIIIDKLLPRILELCSSTSGTSEGPSGTGNTQRKTGVMASSKSLSDRQLYLAAAESLHGIITLMIDSAAEAFRRSSSRDSPFAPLYAKVLPALQLSVSAITGISDCKTVF